MPTCTANHDSVSCDGDGRPHVCTTLYETVPDKPQYVQRKAGRRLRDVCADLLRVLEAEELVDESFGLSPGVTHATAIRGPLTPTSEWPDKVKWIACYPVTGGSEGHWVHVDLLLEADDRPGEYRALPVFLAKTFRGWDQAVALASRIGVLLGV